MKNRQILFTAPFTTELVENEVSLTSDDKILIKTEYTAISGGTERANLTAAENTSKAFPIALGYSGSGTVIEIGKNVKDFAVGDRVIMYHGCHSEYNEMIPWNVTKITDNRLSFEEAAFILIASMSLGGVRKAKIELGESAMVMGLGILGQFAVQLCRASGAYPVIAVDLNEERRNTALNFGADFALDPTDTDFAKKVKELTGGKGINACIEVTGNARALEQALDCASYMGRIVLLGCTRVSDCKIDYYTQVHKPGVSIIGAHNFVRPKTESYPGHWTYKDDCVALMNLAVSGRLNIKDMITDIFMPEQAVSVYERLINDKKFPACSMFKWN